MSFQQDLDLALELADIADAISLKRFTALDLHVETKPDLSPVTDADRSVEQAIKAKLAESVPNDALIGEEFGWHSKLHAWCAGLGNPDCAGNRWQACG
jgi:histidinol-phosphatase